MTAARTTLRIVPPAIAVGVLAALTAWTLLALGRFQSNMPAAHLIAYAAQWLLFAVAVLLLRLAPRRAVPALVLAGAVALGGCALTAPPTTSTDAARYSWDGIVQDAGVPPYRDVPAAGATADLRPAWLFPAGARAADGSLRCPRFTVRTPQVGAPGEICTAVNRPLVHTLYPPVAEIAFALVRLPVPPGVQFLPVQLLGLAAALVTTALLLRALARRALPLRWAALFAWCPLVASEAVNNAHVDALAALLTLAATMLVAGGRPVRGGILLGLAIATKFTPVLAGPSLIRRRPVRVVVAAAGAVVAVYLPYVAASGVGVLGYLPGYLNEEGYDNGARSILLATVLPGVWATIGAGVIVAAVAAVVALRADPVSPWTGQLAVIGIALIVLSPRYAWYGLLLLPPVAMTGRWEWLAVGLVLIPLQLEGRAFSEPPAVLAAAVVALGGTAVRSFVDHRRKLKIH